jgi:predicted DCC family thiol-disulfide oxidoreductase YuxK
VQATLIYDGDCAFCERCSRLVRRHFPGVEVIAWQDAHLDHYGLTAEAAAAAVQFVNASARVSAGHAAIAQLLIHKGGPVRLVGRLMLLPGIRQLANGVYRLVAAHRHRLPGGTPACKPPA